MEGWLTIWIVSSQDSNPTRGKGRWKRYWCFISSTSHCLYYVKDPSVVRFLRLPDWVGKEARKAANQPNNNQAEGKARGELSARKRYGGILAAKAVLLLSQIAAKVCSPPVFNRETTQPDGCSTFILSARIRVLLLAADSKLEMEEWIKTISRRRLIRPAFLTQVRLHSPRMQGRSRVY